MMERAVNTTTGAEGQAMKLPLRKYRVLDFGTAWAGPMAGQLLADMGADVIKVESADHMDGFRKGRPLLVNDEAGGDAGLWPNMQPQFHTLNRNKKSLGVNIRTREGKEVIEKLAAVTDVMINNFSPGVMDRLGIGYARLCDINPMLIMVEQSAAGRSGPWRDLVGYANSFHAFSGLSALIGYLAEPPLGALKPPFGDVAAATATVTAVLSALWTRKRTGRGQYIEVSAIEAGLALTAETTLAASITGQDLAPRGNRHPLLAPQGTYPVLGDDDWISISVSDDGAWRRFVGVADPSMGLEDARFDTLAGRLKFHDELDDKIAAWTQQLSAGQVTELLNRAEVANFHVRDISNLYFCPHHESREVYQATEHPHVGFEPLPGMAWRLHETPGSIRSTAPDLGEHSDEILRDLLGYPAEIVASLREAGVVKSV